MNHRILVVGFACLSVFTAAQSSDKQQKPAATTKASSPKDAPSGQASGRKMNQKAEDDKVIHRDLATRESSAPSVSEIRESPTKSSSSREASAPSVSEINTSASQATTMVRESPSKASLGRTSVRVNGSGRVSAGDVNGDGKSDVSAGDLNGDGMLDTAAKNSGHATEQITVSNGNDQSAPKEVAHGQSAGKRMHEPVKVQKHVDSASPSSK